MATYYFPLKVVITGGTGNVYSSASQVSRFKILIATGTTQTAARNAITGSTSSVYAYTVGKYGNNTFWVTRSTSASTYMAVGVVNPYSYYATTTAKTVTCATSATDTPYQFDISMQPFSTLTSKGRLVTDNVVDYIDAFSDNPLSLNSGAYTSMDICGPSAQNNYVTCFHLADYMAYNQIVDRAEDSYAPWDKVTFYEGNNIHNVSNNFVVITNDLYWSGTSITVYNQSLSSALTISAFDVSATTTANTTVSIFHLASGQSVPAGSSKSVTVTHAASNPVVAASSVTLTLTCSGPAGWNGPVAVQDAKSLFNETANARTLTSTKYITANTSGGTVSVYIRPATRTITAGTGISLRATNTTNMSITIMYLKILAEDVTNGNDYEEIIYVTGNPTIAAGASNVVLGKTITKSSYSGQHLRLSIVGYTSYPTGDITFQASGSTGQNFGVHSVSGIDPANINEYIQWDAGGNVALTGGTIMFKFS